LRKFQTDYVATVDADFEILSPYFIGEMMDALERDPQLIGISSDYTPWQPQYYDSYSGKVFNLAERWNTWFCIYKRQAFNCKTSHFPYYDSSNEPIVFDSGAYFQHRLITDFGYRFSTVDSKYHNFRKINL
jgi:glycosyltransferase involved in cell wall biosynthesis